MATSKFVPLSGAMLALAAGTLAQAPQTFRSTIEAIPIYATVRSDAGALVPDLTRDDFEIKDNGVRRDITVFSRELVPITVTMMLDMSGSTETGAMWMRDAGYAFIDALLPADRVRLGTFGIEVALSPRLTGDATYLRRVLAEEVWPGGGTPLWEAMDRAMTSLASEVGRRVILVLTDGVDTSRMGTMGTIGLGTRMNGASGRSMTASSLETGAGAASKISGRVDREGFMVYAVAQDFGFDPRRGPLNQPLSTAMRDLAVSSGGGYRVFSKNADAMGAMLQVAEELHHQYLIGFTPTVLDGKVHRLDVTTKRGGMSVRARKNYVAVAE